MWERCISDRLEKIAKIQDLYLNGELKTCEQCTIARAWQKNVNKNWKGGIQVPEERLYFDISSITDLI
jgi:hypothetical protein